LIIDAHTHLGTFTSYRSPDVSLDSVIDLMNHLGIDRAVQMHSAGFSGLFAEAFYKSELAYEQSVHRFCYGLIFDPRNPKQCLDWFDHATGQPGFVAVKIHPSFHQVYPDDPRYEPVWRWASKHDYPIITHSWAVSDYNPSQKFSTPEHFEYFASRYPQVQLILGHAGGRFEGHLAAVRLAQHFPNIHLDLAGDVYSPDLIEWLVGQVGAERIIFGSDLVMIDPRTILGRIYASDISLNDKELILGKNACRLFRLPK
jgi:uncharacterized protein